MNLSIFFSVLSLSSVLTSRAQAQQGLTEAVNHAATTYLKDADHQGISIGIVANNKTSYYNYGTIEKGKKQVPAPNTTYEIGSLTKSFTGILLAHAVLDGKIDLDDDVHKYLDGPYPNLSFGGHPVRIIDLADHTAGFGKNVPEIKPGETVDEIFQQYKGLTRQQFLKDLAAVKLDTIPGTRFNYSNAGAQLIGIILERVYNMSYSDLVKKYISGPNHMNDTRCEIPAADSGRFAKGYDEKGNLAPRISIWKNIPAAGYLKSTARDIVEYIKLNMNEADPAIALAHQIIFKNTSEYNADIGLFWFIKRSAGGNRRVEHAGGSFGATSYCMVYPGLKTGIVILTNDASAGTEREIRKMADEVLSRAGLVK